MSTKPNNIALVVGAGAVENAWLPIIKALQPLYKYELDGDAAYCALSRFIYLMRFTATGTFPGVEERKNEALENFLLIKKAIAAELKAAQLSGLIKARPEFGAILSKFVFSEVHKAIVVSTNWDTVIDHEINQLGESNFPVVGSDIETLHIHGSMDEPSGMYLPSEIVREPYRSKEDDEKMGMDHGTIWQTLEDCNSCVLYGLSLDPLDAELSQTLVAGWSTPRIKEIIVIDPNHAKVANRVKFLTDERYPVKITGYHPADLNKAIVY